MNMACITRLSIYPFPANQHFCIVSLHSRSSSSRGGRFFLPTGISHSLPMMGCNQWKTKNWDKTTSRTLGYVTRYPGRMERVTSLMPGNRCDWLALCWLYATKWPCFDTMILVFAEALRSVPSNNLLDREGWKTSFVIEIIGPVVECFWTVPNRPYQMVRFLWPWDLVLGIGRLVIRLMVVRSDFALYNHHQQKLLWC